MNKEQFRKLQQKWYDIISGLGFEDAEEFKGDALVLKQRAAYPLRKVNSITKAAKEEYFLLLSQMVQDESTTFRNALHKHVLSRRAEGISIKIISEETSMHRQGIRFLIRRYEMAWGIRYYTPEQLNNYKKTG